ncbi:hypothetical protein FD40_GL000426 [Amylolactobacillus amylophilus DSM 20533 = JCM 1125]|uniref:HicB-like antitoxin of toxin-antitoxin system domain-containing protein n=4 Tax=Amylolactobacillus TaxID=2767876 RepID=A0A0R1YRX7_9LACO|nr:hypothetical protein FD40_GL000426 [Amylolactobacillus amylophilus DSM 20533 = JCM 1125]GED79942.1 hypothetical protein LAM01_04150 [Amylolactobacillus amylophilus]
MFVRKDIKYTMKNKILVYPTIFAEFHDDGDYFTVTSPNIEGMITQGDTREDAVIEAVDAIATMIDGEDYPKPMDPSSWRLKSNESIVYISVDMKQWYLEKEKRLKTKTVKRTITIPEYLDNLARERKVNVSGLVRKALEKELI